MLLPNRNASTGDGYRFGFQGQEKDDEIKGNGNSINFEYRMHDPRIGRFFAIDPLTSKYPHYTPYSFSGNKVIQYIELEGLEEGELKIYSEASKEAVLTWTKVYYQVNDGVHKVHAPVDGSRINSIYNSGNKVLYVNHLPGDKRKNGKEYKIRYMSERAYRKGRAWKVDIVYDIKVQQTTLAEAEQKLSENKVLNGMLVNESYGYRMSFPTAGGYVNTPESNNKDIIFMNDEVFGLTPLDINLTNHGVEEMDLVAHEIGHNFGLHHETGDYGQEGLMSNLQKFIKPSKKDNKKILNLNLKSIKRVE